VVVSVVKLKKRKSPPLTETPEPKNGVDPTRSIAA
jgi:hypothetical protein